MMRLPFKKLLIWQKSMELTKIIYENTVRFPKQEVYGLTSQMRKCALSVPSNIAEGSQRTSDKEYCNFLLIAKGSLAELETQVLLSQSLEYLSQESVEEILCLIDECSKMLRSLYGKIANHYPLTTHS